MIYSSARAKIEVVFYRWSLILIGRTIFPTSAWVPKLFLMAIQFRNSASDRDLTTNMYLSGIVVPPIQNDSYLSFEHFIQIYCILPTRGLLTQTHFITTTTHFFSLSSNSSTTYQGDLDPGRQGNGENEARKREDWNEVLLTCKFCVNY